ncbi:hypothetical protein SAMN05660297_00108 [Natronincola peptidivorans]|uniref:Uncharacterized protein n=1 Tax=Natronincola peptidivorans TaxID=426128 RepID=A0A1H9Y992_9FIRM|nr:hypothetical protein [Natronincola peptidivorans]SES65397.1 hypothetical protein SAMN05660297_00108 [Natronincola peptidivorans]
MEWAEKVIETFESIRDVNILIRKVLDRVAKELVDAHEKNNYLDRSKSIATRSKGSYVIFEDNLMINDFTLLSHNKILNKLLERNKTLKGLTEERVYRIIKEMLLEETELYKIINSKHQEETIEMDNYAARMILRKLEDIHEELIVIKNSI